MLVMGAVSVQAGVHFSFGIGIPAPVVVAPAPVYVVPAPPVYFAPPRPVYVAPPPPVYYAPPRPVYVAPPPLVVRPPVVHFGLGFGHRPHHHYRHHGCR